MIWGWIFFFFFDVASPGRLIYIVPCNNSLFLSILLIDVPKALGFECRGQMRCLSDV